MITPSGIPQFTGDFDQLDQHVSALKSEAIGIRNGGADVHSRFQMLGAFYSAPEADTLFATTQPVMDTADVFATKLETVAAVLDTYTYEARPHAQRLQQLKADAITFTDSVAGDDDWTEDEDKVHRHQDLMDGVATAQAAFQEAERQAASKISALVGGPRFVEDDGHHTVDQQTVMYGYGLDDLKNAKELPWGTPEEQTYDAWSAGWFWHGAKSFVWDGLVMDNVVGSLDGLWTLFGGHGADAAGDAWSGLRDIVGGIGLYTAAPYDWLMDKTLGPAPADPTEDRYKKATREFLKGLVAWDTWAENPARASATVVFNVLTFGVGPLAAVSKAGEAGTAAKAAGIASKVGEFIDPVNAAFKATAQVTSRLPTLTELTTRLLPTDRPLAADTHGVHSVIELDDGSKVLIQDGQFIAYDRHGDLVPTQELPDTPPARDHAMAAAPSHHASAHTGDNLTPGNDHHTPAGHSSTHHTHSSTGDTTGDTGTRHGPGTVGPPHGHGGSDGGLDDLSRTGGDIPDGPDGTTPPNPAERPAHMQDGANPYGPRGSLSLEQIEEIQVYRANHEPGYVERYYKDNGWRKNLKFHDESGYAPPQLARFSEDALWVRAKDTPAPPEPHFLDADYTSVKADTVTSDARREILKEAARDRYFAIEYDNLARRWKDEAGQAHHIHGTIDSAAEWGEARGTYKESHTQMGDRAEEFGEKTAKYHYIAENYPDFVDQPLLGPRSGNDQFDQVWKHEDGRIIVIEAKSSPGTELGSRALPNGRRVSQGSREYLMDILRVMRKRGETDLVRHIQKAMKDDKLEYVVVKGERNAITYTGYQYRRFDISKGTLP